MRKISVFFVVCALFGSLLPLGAQEITKGSVVVVPMEGPVTQAQFFFLRRVLKDAERAGAGALILNMDTPGGELKTTEQIVQALSKVTFPTYTYVNPNAGSAGALIALATKHVYMAPISAVGAAAPVMGGGAEVPETMNAKMVSYYSGYFRSVAEKNGYNPNLVDAFMNLKKEVKIGDEVLNPEGAVLTLSAQEAVKEYDGKPLMAQAIVDSLEELCEKAGLPVAQIVRVEPGGFERIALWITALAPLFLLGGILGAYMEFKTPGFGIAGVLSAICFLIYFTGHYIAGLTGFEVAAVFVLGVLLILIELIFFPGVFVFAALGTALMVCSLLFAMVDFYPAQPVSLSFDMLAGPLIKLGIALMLSVFGIALLARFLPDLPFFNRLVLGFQTAEGPSFRAPSASAYEVRVQVGDEGVARTILRPAGQAKFGQTLVDVVADGEFIEPGSPVRVRAVEGKRVVVDVI